MYKALRAAALLGTLFLWCGSAIATPQTTALSVMPGADALDLGSKPTISGFDVERGDEAGSLLLLGAAAEVRPAAAARLRATPRSLGLLDTLPLPEMASAGATAVVLAAFLLTRSRRVSAS